MHGRACIVTPMKAELTYLTTSEVADQFRVDSATVRRWAVNGILPSITLPGGRYRFRPEDVDALHRSESAA